tara:strand:+ start:1533 stop:2390 length:858 start_codon:yes stop_codon:yes gene_type:complete
MVYPKIMRVHRINSRAKINLNLNVIGKSKLKKLHIIESLVCFVNLYDKIYISKLKSNSHRVIFTGKFSKNITKENTITNLLSMLDKNNVLKNKYKILIKKEIPLQSGMGGGSMNAANLLNFFYKNKFINFKELKKYASKIGSDVILGFNSKPKILYRDGSVKEVTNIKKYHILIVKPSFGCSTKKIYSANKTFSRFEFNKTKKHIVKNVVLNGKNDLEKSAFKLYPALKKIKNLLVQNKQASFVRMTGSGSAIIMYFSSNKFAKNALKIYKRKLNNCLCIITKIV